MIDRHLELFLEEAYELLADLEIALLELEEKPADMELIGRVFRALHTIKGSGGMVGLDEIAAFTHEVETVFDRVRDGQIAVTKELVNLTLAARDQIKVMLDAVGSGIAADQEQAQEIVALTRQLISTAGEPAAAEATSPPSDNAQADTVEDNVTYRIRFRPALDIFMDGTDPLMLLEELGELGECQVVAHAEDVPPLAEINPESCYTYWDVILTTQQGLNAIKDVFIFVEDDCELNIEVVSEELEAETVAQEEIAPEMVEFEAAAGDQEQAALAKPDLEPRKTPPGKDGASQPKSQAAQNVSSIRVPADKLDQLVNLVGELVTVQARFSQTVDSPDKVVLVSIAEEVERLTGELRDITLNIRMIPIGTTFSQFKRLVRDLSNKLGKEIKLVTRGAETELDKTVIERLNDPLVHLIRNSIDHGIECPEVRQAAGKAGQGTIHLSAIHSGGNVLIRIKDDGAGLNLEAIRARAVEKELITAEEELSDKELSALLFAPGFSTATQVTDVSGRGVGLDVVKGAIDALRGDVEIDSRQGVGTTITLKLPLTLAIIDGLLVRVGQECFALPLLAVEECVELTRNDAAQAHGRNLVNVRGEIVPYIRLREWFNINGETPAIEQVVITESGNRRVGFVVDQIVGEYQTVIKTLSQVYRNVEEVSGATILGDGTVALILDISKLVHAAELAERAAL